MKENVSHLSNLTLLCFKCQLSSNVLKGVSYTNYVRKNLFCWAIFAPTKIGVIPVKLQFWRLPELKRLTLKIDYNVPSSSSGAVGFSGATFGRGRGHIFMDEVNCTGSESTLVDCPFSGWNVNNCGHSEDASVICQTGRTRPGG